MSNLLWFNKEGDALNLNYDDTTGIYTGTLNFDQNSSDTFKTLGLYLFEKIDSFEFDSIDNDLGLQKFQLFNEKRFTFTGNSYFTQSVTAIEAVNNNSDFYSKWIYGIDFENKFPIGSCIIFNSPIFEFTVLNYTYVVVATKKNAIMIVSSTDNKTFNTLYSGLTFSNRTISGINSIGIYDYRKGLFDQLSLWNEPSFYTKLYDGKKITIIGKTSSVVTISDKDIIDRLYYKYNIDSTSYTQDSDLLVNLTLKTDLPNIYTGSIDIMDSKVYFNSGVPKYLKPGTAFVINESILNQYYITVDSIPSFNSSLSAGIYATGSQTIWGNFIYECIQSYYYTATSSITPDNVNYWTSSISYVPANYVLNNETLLDATVHLTTNKLTYTQTYTYSNAVTMALFAERYSKDFSIFDIDLYYSDNKLNADLKWPTTYANVDFIVDNVNITNKEQIKENVFRTKETLFNYVDVNFSENFKYSIVITDIDDFGLKILINGQNYQENVDWIYNGLNVDLRKSIDRTLRNFLFKNFSRLTSLGIDLTLDSSVYSDEFEFYKDTLTFKTHYPNVPLLMSVEMGTTANFYVKHSKVSFEDIGAYFSLNINGKEYGQVVTSSTSSVFISDIETAVTNWVDAYQSILEGYGILVSNTRTTLYLNTVQTTTRLVYTVKTNKLATPGIEQYKITKYYSGNKGSLLAGNELVLGATSSQNFETAGFATGMITSVNNTVYPYNNQEYNIIHLESSKIGLSYQGPFFDTAGKECNLSSFTTLAFSPLAYTQSPCPPAIAATSSGGQFDVGNFNGGFFLTYVIVNDYESYYYDVNNTNQKDALYINEYDKIYIGGYNLAVIDATTMEVIKIINLPTKNIIKLVYNSYNKYIYAVTATNILVIDPTTNTVYKTISVGVTDIRINQNNGDVYISNSSLNIVYIYYYNSFTTYNKALSVTNAGKIEYNLIDDNMYIVGNNVYVINTTTRTIQATYTISGLLNSYIFTEPIYGSMYVWSSTYLYKILDGTITQITNVPYNGSNEILYDNFTGDLFITQNNLDFNRITTDDVEVYSTSFGFGDIVLSQYDSDIYMFNSIGKIYVIQADSGYVKYTLDTGLSSAPKIIFNPLRNSVIAIGSDNKIFELSVILNSSISLSATYSTPSSLSEGVFGTLDPNYVPKTNVWLKTRQYLRTPRQNFTFDNSQVQFVYKFKEDNIPQIFMYDVSGNQLPTGTSFSYVGPKPLPEPYLNDLPNMDVNKINDSSVQQTIFDEIVNDLDFIDSDTNISILPTPIELFLGYNDEQEGYVKTNLKLYQRENVSFSLNYDSSLENEIFFIDKSSYGIIQMATMSSQSFLVDDYGIKRGLKVGQLIKIEVSDITNVKNKYISYNNGSIFKITEIYSGQIILDYIDITLYNETTVVSNYPYTNQTTYLKLSFTVLDKEIASFDLYGQTEIEDIRYKIELSNTGHLINPEDAYIFNTYDIDEQGIDWRFLNQKRKEMIIVRHDIFPYVGSYKAIINAINYFGYNDLELYEYYRNVNINDPNFFKLFKVEIPDIFDNTVKGFTINDFLKHTMPNPNFEDTNLFNLTYKITDKQGNNVMMYSLQEVIIKLQGLKKWLENKVVPITHRILDITGRADFVGGNFIQHKSFSRKSYNFTEKMTPIDFKINEAYLMPVNSGSTVYNVVVDFITPKVNNYPTNFTLNIRTYKTYKEWNAFTTYSKDDEVIYYGIIYKSFIDSNKILDPRKYSEVSNWISSNEYFNGQMVNYKRHIYEYLGATSSYYIFGSQSNITPAQTDVWLDISEWIVQDLVPVQTITEYRYINSVTYSLAQNNVLYYPTNIVETDYLTVSKPFNFSIDSNIDPFITVEVTSDNGYGLVYSSKKNYEIRGSNDLFSGVQSIEPIGPFIPITPVTNSY